MINDSSNMINDDEMIFSLDIGTRTVIGIVATYEDNKLKILASEIVEHEARSMYDGQIHNIAQVAEVVKKVKTRLESKTGKKLDKVSIAAAGRSLETSTVHIERKIDYSQPIGKRLIESLEMEAIQKAQKELEEKSSRESTQFYCVGYSVVNYYLEDNLIENLEGHRGNKISADILSTFLPHTVVDSLYTVMSRVGLEVVNLTLEPIAAINIAIKKSLRLLNLALVDIGAGTSDIAITKDGTIIAYAMAAIAGDEITEKIAKTLLLDYDVAERLKISLGTAENHRFHDIVGIEHNLTSEEILNRIEETIKNLAKEIGNKILQYNEKAPSVIFLIGGGSQIPYLTKYLAEYLEMPEARVVVRDASIVENVEGLPKELLGPNAITPLGIAKTAIDNKYKDFLEVIVNGKKVKLFNSKQIKVSNALVLIGFNPRNLIPKRGEDFVYYLNGEERRIKGEMGEAAQIYINDKKANLEYRLLNGDVIKVEESTAGSKIQRPKLYQCIGSEKTVLFNDNEIKLLESIKVNDEIVTDNIYINEKDEIVIKDIETLEQLFNIQGLDIKDYRILVNGEELDEEGYSLSSGDIITTSRAQIVEESKNEKHSKDLEDNCFSSTENNRFGTIIELTINDDKKVIHHNKGKFVFVDIFNHIDFDLSRPNGTLVLKVNGIRAQFTQELKNGDNIEVYWEKKAYS